MVLDNTFTQSRATLAALAARAHWLAVKQLPNYAPELNDIEPYGATSRSIISPTCQPAMNNAGKEQTKNIFLRSASASGAYSFD